MLGFLVLFLGSAAHAAAGRDGQPTPAAAPYEVKQVEVMVPMPDGVRLWGCLSLPIATRPTEKFPALLSLDPYSGACTPRALAGNGYVMAYFHVRGTGHSEGRFPSREYSEEELQDAVDLIDWLSRQPWSTGRVGMFGASWSAFNTIQVAMRRPPALKAIVAYVGTEDLYNEDTRFADGIMRFDEYNALADLSLITSLPPENPLEESTLRNRFDQAPWSLLYLRQQQDGDFWRRSIRLDANPRGLQLPIFMIGGWYDGYRTAIPRALRHLGTPARAIVGPWDHGTKNPPPSADLDREALRWWDHFLKDKPTGVLKDPQLIAYMRRPHIPRPSPGPIPGEWRSVPKWPPQDLEERRFFLGSDRLLSTRPTTAGTHRLRYVPSGGAQAGIWWGDPMPDQRPADAFSLVYESEPLASELQMLGIPKATLRASATAPHAIWAVRLSDVAPDGTVTLVTGGGLNGAHRNSAVEPERLIPGETYSLTVGLHFSSWIFEPGHRIRVAVSNSLWPMFWPSPYPMVTTLHVGSPEGSSFLLPVVPPQSPEAARAAAAAVGSTNVASAQGSSATESKPDWVGAARVERDEIAGTTTVSYARDGGKTSMLYRVKDSEPDKASILGTCARSISVGGHAFEWRGRTEIASDSTTFHYRHRRELLRDGVVVRERTWEEAVPRNFQ